MENEKRGSKATDLSRRNFIATAGLAATGGVLVSGAAAFATMQKDPEATPVAGNWPWVKLDPQEAAERAFRNYHAKGG